MALAFRRLLPALLAATAAVPLAHAQAPAPVEVIHAGHLLDVRSGQMLDDMYVSYAGGRIVAVSHQAPAGSAPRDLTAYTVLPGLIDAHVHLMMPWPDYSAAAQFRASTAVQTLWGVKNARIYLDQGFTTVRDACEGGPAGSTYAMVALREAVAKGEVDGPRIITAGQCISVTGGHGDGFNLPVEMGLPRPTNVADTPDEIEKVVRRDIKYGADWIKLMGTGGTVDPISDYTVQELSDAQFARAVETAHRAGHKVMVHAEGTAGITAAARAGVDSIEHGTMLDEEGARLMAAKHIWLVPTLVCFQRSDSGEEGATLPPASAAKIRKILAYQQPAFALALRYKIRIAMGDDDYASGAHEELGAMVRAGLSPLDTIRAATINAAEMLDVPAGLIEPGRSADMIAVKGDPTRDITALYKVAFVLNRGKVEKAPDGA